MSPHPVPRTLPRRVVPVTALAVSALAFAGCGGDGNDESSTPAKASTAAATAAAAPKAALADDVPARAAAYVESTFRPGGEAKAAIEQLSALFGIEDPGAELIRGLDLDEEIDGGRTFEKDVLPHLGDHVAAFLLNASSPAAAKEPQAAIVAEVRDAAAVRAALEPSLRKDSRTVDVDGQRVYVNKDGEVAAWIGDQTMSVGTEAAVRATIAAAKGDTLDKNARYGDAMGQVEAQDPLGIAWVDMKEATTINGAISRAAEESSSSAARKPLPESELKDLPPALRKRLESQMGKGGPGGALSQFQGATLPAADASYALALQAKPGRITVSGGAKSAKGDEGASKAAADAVAALPGGSWLAFGGAVSASNASGQSVAETLKQLEAAIGPLPAGLKDGLSKVRTVTGSVRGDNLLGAGGAMILQTSDAASAKALMDGLAEVVKARTPLSLEPKPIDGTDAGMIAALPGMPVQIAVGVNGDRMAIGLGADSITAAFKPSSKLSSDPAYARAKEALGGKAPVMLVNPKPLADLVGSLGVPDARQATEAINRVKLIAAGSESTGATTWRGTFIVDYDASNPTP